MRQLEFAFPTYCDRINGFTIPHGNVFYFCNFDEVWEVTIADVPRVEVMDQSPYEFMEGNADFLGLVMSGATANQPVMHLGSTGISYDFDPKGDFVDVRCQTASGISSLRLRTLSGDWFAASLSSDGRYLVLAEPYHLALYEVT